MATPINTPVAGEIWHLSIDDLLATPVAARPRLGGPGPFVINLSASTAPISQPPKALEACPAAHVYQIQRIEDRRLRFRLRLGPFASEDEAESVLDKVRDLYPSALTATADADDARAIESIQARLSALRKPERPVASAPVQVPRAAPIPVLSDRVEPMSGPVVSAGAAPIPTLVHAAVPERTIAAAPIAVLAPIPVPATPAAALREAPQAMQAMQARQARQATSATATVTERAAVAPSRLPEQSVRRIERPAVQPPSIESTQTIRPITPLELESDDASRWFVIQLSIAERTFDPDALPNLDIFSEYRLYSVAGLDQGRIMHSLRLGFFGDAVAAGAVASYLASFYENPAVKRVSAAERERFAEQRVEARKDIGATGRHAVIEITSERIQRDSRGGSVSVLPCIIGPVQAQGASARKR